MHKLHYISLCIITKLHRPRTLSDFITWNFAFFTIPFCFSVFCIVTSVTPRATRLLIVATIYTCATFGTEFIIFRMVTTITAPKLFCHINHPFIQDTVRTGMVKLQVPYTQSVYQVNCYNLRTFHISGDQSHFYQ